MEPLIIEIGCALSPQDPRWNEIETLSVEIGYPNKEGKTHWKHIGWLRDALTPLRKTFSHALWSKSQNRHKLLFDFLPIARRNTAEPQTEYLLRKRVTTPDGRSRTSRPTRHNGNFTDDFVHIKIHVP